MNSSLTNNVTMLFFITKYNFKAAAIPYTGIQKSQLLC